MKNKRETKKSDKRNAKAMKEQISKVLKNTFSLTYFYKFAKNNF